MNKVSFGFLFFFFPPAIIGKIKYGKKGLIVLTPPPEVFIYFWWKIINFGALFNMIPILMLTFANLLYIWGSLNFYPLNSFFSNY